MLCIPRGHVKTTGGSKVCKESWRRGPVSARGKQTGRDLVGRVRLLKQMEWVLVTSRQTRLIDTKVWAQGHSWRGESGRQRDVVIGISVLHLGSSWVAEAYIFTVDLQNGTGSQGISGT